MLVTTTFNIDGYPVKKYFGIVHGEVILGANFWRDWMAGLTNFLGGRSGAYEKSLASQRKRPKRARTRSPKTRSKRSPWHPIPLFKYRFWEVRYAYGDSDWDCCGCVNQNQLTNKEYKLIVKTIF
jgi:Putative heavy-metal-binding